MAEGEKLFRAAIFFYGLSDYKYGELKDNFHNSYLVGVDIIPQTYYDVPCIADGFKPTTAHQHNSDRAQKDKAVVDFVSRAEVK